MPNWVWAVLGGAVGVLLVGIPVLWAIHWFVRELDRATGWGGWQRIPRRTGRKNHG